MTGLRGAAGGVETIFSVLAIKDSVIPQPLTLKHRMKNVILIMLNEARSKKYKWL
ncbi:hypothetical protein ACEQPO_09220 [Bacillus sp. SL00103]